MILNTLMQWQWFEALITILNDKEESLRIRQKAAMIIGKKGSPEAYDVLMEALENTDPGIGHAIARALVEVGDRRAIGLLEKHYYRREANELKQAPKDRERDRAEEILSELGVEKNYHRSNRKSSGRLNVFI